MAEIWGRSDLSPATKSVFNWKIENFQRMLKIIGQTATGFYSPRFDVVGLDGKVHSLKLRVTQFTSTSYKGYSVTGVSEAANSRPMGEVVPFQVDVAYIPCDLMLAGTIEMELNGQTILGSIGNAEQDKFEKTITNFTNQTYPVTIKTSSKDFEADSIFCVATTQDVLEMKVQLCTPGNMTSSTSLVPTTNEQTAKQVGESRLLSDIKALLDSVDKYADFNIECEGENFPCHEAILRDRSPVFDKMFLQKLREWNTREMIMDDVKKETVGHLLEYIYTGQVTKLVENDAELIYVADKYHIAGLMELCLRKLPEVEDNKVVDILILADRHNLEDFKKLSMQRILKDKNKFLKDEDFVTKLNGTPHILMDFFKL